MKLSKMHTSDLGKEIETLRSQLKANNYHLAASPTSTGGPGSVPLTPEASARAPKSPLGGGFGGMEF